MALSPRLLFLSFLGLGLITGLFVGSLGEAIAAPLAKSTQQNTLFLLVDDMNAEHPTLQGIWLAAKSLGSDAVNWVPVYPQPLKANEDPLAQPHSAFYLPDRNFDDPSNLPPLRAQGAWWSEVIWLDKAALGVLQSATGQEASTITDPWVEPQQALYEQVQILNAICGAPSLFGIGAMDQMLALIPNHLRSSISPFELITAWDSWSQGGYLLSCSHPWAD
jgi:hypothetical protein